MGGAARGANRRVRWVRSTTTIVTEAAAPEPLGAPTSGPRQPAPALTVARGATVDAAGCQHSNGPLPGPSLRSARASTSIGAEYMTQMRKLGELRDAGTLTEEEFAAKKSEILSRI